MILPIEFVFLKMLAELILAFYPHSENNSLYGNITVGNFRLNTLIEQSVTNAFISLQLLTVQIMG